MVARDSTRTRIQKQDTVRDDASNYHSDPTTKSAKLKTVMLSLFVIPNALCPGQRQYEDDFSDDDSDPEDPRMKTEGHAVGSNHTSHGKGTDYGSVPVDVAVDSHPATDGGNTRQQNMPSPITQTDVSRLGSALPPKLEVNMC